MARAAPPLELEKASSHDYEEEPLNINLNIAEATGELPEIKLNTAEAIFITF